MELGDVVVISCGMWDF